MEWLFAPMDSSWIYAWEQFLGDWVFVIALVFFALELLRYAAKKQFNRQLLGDSVANFITLGLFLAVSWIAFAGLQIGLFSWASQFALLDIQTTWATVFVCIILADLIYYWEHRIMHRANGLWMTHMVHHSSPCFNISVAYRFGPFDGFWPVFFHLPLAFLGFDPFVIFFAEMVVQLYQTLLHTETVGKLPRPIEAVLNTPSHHRVHHASNPQYLDSNYAGIFIIWDRMFGTFAREEEAPVYGLVTPINSINPLRIFFAGFAHLYHDFRQARSLRAVGAAIIMPPGHMATIQQEDSR